MSSPLAISFLPSHPSEVVSPFPFLPVSDKDDSVVIN